jgi:hypothetical protein
MSDKELEEKTEEWRKFYGVLRDTSLSAGFGGLEDRLHLQMKVLYCHPNSGYPEDQEKAMKHLKYGSVYTVIGWEQGSWRTDLYLREVDGFYNSVLFEEQK